MCKTFLLSNLYDIVMAVWSKEIQAASAIQQAAVMGAAWAERVKDLSKKIHLFGMAQGWIFPLLFILLELRVGLHRRPGHSSDPNK